MMGLLNYTHLKRYFAEDRGVRSPNTRVDIPFYTQLAQCRWIIVLLFLFTYSNLAAQQKAMYTQYMFNGLALNPAYSATDDALSISCLFRQQWVGLEGAPNTQTVSLHSPI